MHAKKHCRIKEGELPFEWGKSAGNAYPGGGGGGGVGGGGGGKTFYLPISGGGGRDGGGVKSVNASEK